MYLCSHAKEKLNRNHCWVVDWSENAWHWYWLLIQMNKSLRIANIEWKNGEGTSLWLLWCCLYSHLRKKQSDKDLEWERWLTKEPDISIQMGFVAQTPFCSIRRSIHRSLINVPFDILCWLTMSNAKREESHLASRIDQVIVSIGWTHLRDDTSRDRINAFHATDMNGGALLRDSDHLRRPIFDTYKEVTLRCSTSILPMCHYHHELVASVGKERTSKNGQRRLQCHRRMVVLPFWLVA